MQVIGALQAKAGAKTEYSKLNSLTQPVQFLPAKQKDEAWTAWNMDWLELQGIRQLKKNSRKFLKNIRLANGIIDRNDYVPDDSNEDSALISLLSKEEDGVMDLKYYPIIPNALNVMVGEFSKRVSKLMFRDVSDLAYNEMAEQKRQMLEETLMKQAEQKLMMQLIDQGMDPESEEAQQALSPENLKSLPEIEAFFSKDYRSLIEEWATHQKQVDEERFKMQELEEKQFKTMLTLDREFWHFKMNEDDYEVEIWDPVFTFYHKSPETRYISQGNFVGKIDLVSVADVIDKYGYLMSEAQMRTLEKIYPVKSLTYNDMGVGNNGSMYDGSKSYKWNTSAPSVGYRQLASFQDNFAAENQDIISWLMNDNEDDVSYGNSRLIRTTTIYWKTQRKIGFLTKIDDDGAMVQKFVDETFPVTCKPLYDTYLFTNKSKDNLVYGEHIDWVWINEVWGGVKIGANRPTAWMNEPQEINPIYLGINRSTPGRVPFQFKGDKTLYGCKLPVEGAVFTDRNIKSVSLVDLMKPFQIGYNLVNNQIADILVDELGTVILLDQNSLPKNSMGEDWGKGNLAKAFVAMKNFQMLPLDTHLSNTEGASQFNQYTQLNLEQTNRLMSRVQLSKYFKEAAMEVVGITPQRLGNVAASETATGTQQAVNNSYAQTEPYFTHHCDWLMPRVHQMRTDLAQYYHSNKPSVRLQYITSMDERVNFQMDGTDLLMRDMNVYCTTKVNNRAILDQMKQLALTNNTAGASIFDLGNVIKSESIAELSRVLKEAEQKSLAERQEKMKADQELQQAQIAAEEKALAEARAFDAEQNQLDRETEVLTAEIKSSGFGNGQDVNQNGNSDYLDNMKMIQNQAQFRDQLNLEHIKESNKTALARQKMVVDKQQIDAENTRSRASVTAARLAAHQKARKEKTKK